MFDHISIDTMDERRDVWTFTYSSTAVLTAAKKKLEHHQGRLEWWQGEQKKTMEKIKAEGLEINESDISYKMSNYGETPSVRIDAKLLKDVKDAQNKINDHKAKVNEFTGWVDCLSAYTQPLQLTLKDWLYFFGK